jgi:GPH family glycoside/pentoside/hexuronide:cation symporter
LNPPAQADVVLESALPPRTESERVPLRTLLSWGPPVSALSATLLFLQFFFLKFATDVLLMAPAVVGVIFASGRLWDAISDPIVGTWSDRTQTRLGRRRPWMLVGIPLIALTLLMTWMPPETLSGPGLVAWVTVALFGFYTAYTIYSVPHQSLGSELTTDHHDRSRIFGVYNASFTVGMLCAFGGMQFVMNSDDQRAAAAQLASAVVLVVILVLLIPPTRVRERPEYQGRGAASSFGALRDVVQNRHAQRLLFVQFVQMLGTGVIGILSPYLVQYILKRPDLVGPLPALFVIFNLASIPVWVLLSRRFGKRRVWLCAMVAAGLVFGSMTFVGEGDVLMISLLLPAAGFALGCGGTVGPSILADVIDSDELETGERKEGAYNAAWGFAFKSSNALTILVTSLVLQGIGFEPNVEQTDFAKLAIRGLFGLMPLTMFLCAAAVFRGFGLDEAEHIRIRAALDARAEGSS